MDAHDGAGDHVEYAGAAQNTVFIAEGQAVQGAVGPHGVLVVDQNDFAVSVAQSQAHVGHAVDVDEIRFDAQSFTHECGKVFCPAFDGFFVRGRGFDVDDSFDVGEHLGESVV